MILNKKFYRHKTLRVAKNLIGKYLVREIDGKKLRVKIVETEAYLGKSDKASHAFKNKRTDRTKYLYRCGGTVYIYLIYGIYYCLNIVTSSVYKPHSVFIRAAEPIEGIKEMKQFRKKNINDLKELTNGPSKLCQSLKLDKTFNGKKVYNPDSELVIMSSENVEKNYKINKSPRINIDYAREDKDKKWRFYLSNSEFCSN
ncbi:MAG: DNA-3-methyladenine glycosylase [Candidatus Mcinerneyibacterium aminivorans]|uniref:Putative 3-methyladenine DNA glycosylase n=1 Tax=Candidatus Mcinerneyibacterium aminivorans TaxID=2703815 RepID=A0A5D0MID9_9BACT|nr:MAG: DNA-3-methyladenine glycosylase [Candidatus Mcinerneyibacterium aminivorans]